MSTSSYQSQINKRKKEILQSNATIPLPSLDQKTASSSNETLPPQLSSGTSIEAMLVLLLVSSIIIFLTITAFNYFKPTKNNSINTTSRSQHKDSSRDARSQPTHTDIPAANRNFLNSLPSRLHAIGYKSSTITDIELPTLLYPYDGLISFNHEKRKCVARIFINKETFAYYYPPNTEKCS